MQTYDAGVRIEIKLTYYLVLATEARTPAEAEEKLRWQALGLSRQEADALCDGHAASSYEGSETTVVDFGQVGPVGWAPEDGPMPDDGSPALDPDTAGR
jgi:hypothetical protein